MCPTPQLLVAQSAVNLQEVTFEATSISARILVEQQSYHSAKSLLRGRLESSAHYPYWHIRLLLQLADVCMSERDERGVTNVLNKCAEYARQVDAPYTRSALFRVTNSGVYDVLLLLSPSLPAPLSLHLPPFLSPSPPFHPSLSGCCVVSIKER